MSIERHSNFLMDKRGATAIEYAQRILLVDVDAGDLGDRLFLSASSGFASVGMVI